MRRQRAQCCEGAARRERISGSGNARVASRGVERLRAGLQVWTVQSIHRLSWSKPMAEVTYYVALPFVAADDGIAAGEPVECFNPVAVVMRAEALSRKEGNVGAVAFSRMGY